MSTIRLIATSSMLLWLVACAPEMPNTKPDPVKKQSVKANINRASPLWQALTTVTPDAQVETLLNHSNINQPNAQGVTPLMAIAATRSPALMKKALALAGTQEEKLLDLLDFIQALHGLESPAQETLDKTQFILSGTATKPGDTKLSKSDAAELIQKWIMIKQQQTWGQGELEIKRLQQEQQQWVDNTQRQIDQLSQVAEIPKPELPPVQRFKKSPFESLAQFQQRMDKARRLRETQVKALLSNYRSKVEARNRLVEENNRQLKQLERQTEAQQVRYQQQLQVVRRRLEQQIERQQPEYIAEAMAAIYGAPWLTAIEENGAPKYDPERGLMFANLGFSHLRDPQEVVLSVPPGKGAETLYRSLKSRTLPPEVRFDLSSTNRQAALTKVSVQHNRKTYLAERNAQSEFSATAPLEVVLESTETAPRIAQDQLDRVVFNDRTLQTLTLQNPNIKDVAFEAYLVSEQKAFNDDIPQLLKRTLQAPINKHQWLFVIGIGAYDKTDNILYARRSAKLFAQVASKTLGIDPSRQILLLDQEASSGRIQDELRLMLSKIRPGDKITFYYSGHGLPVAEEGNAPYLLPADKIPDFIAADQERYYRAENIYKKLANSRADQVIAYMDSCFTGATDGKSVFGGNKAATRLQPKRMRFDTAGNIAVFTAGTDKQFSNALPETGHRLFSYYLMKGLLKGYGNVGELATRVSADVNDKSLDLGGLNRQTPMLTGNPKLTLR